MTRLIFLLWLLLVLGAPARVFGHDLAIDQLTLFPEPGSGVLRGQLLFDPLLTRPRGAPADAGARARVVGFLRANLQLEVDGRSAELGFEVRELWTGDGAIAGDSVMLRADLPKAPRELRVFVGAPLRALAVSVEMPNSQGSLVPRSTLVLGGSASPPYRFATDEPGERWALGGPGELRLGELRHGELRHGEDGSAEVRGDSAPASAHDERGVAEKRDAKAGLWYLLVGSALIAVAGLVWTIRRRFWGG